MKKLFIFALIILSFILQKGVYDISRTIFVSTIHLAKNEAETEITFFVPSSFSVGKSEGENKLFSSTLKVSGKSLKETFNNAEQSSELELNYRHIVSVVFDRSYLKYELLNEFCDFLIENKRIDFNFYIFTSNEKADDLFSFKNPENTSSYYSILNVRSKSDYLFKYAKPLHFLDFSRGLNKEKYSIKIPNLGVLEDYQIDGEKSKNIYLKGVTIYQEKKIFEFDGESKEEILYINSFEYGRLYVDELKIVIQSIKYKIKSKEKPTVIIKVGYEALVDFDELKIKDFINNKVQLAYNLMLKEQIDYYNLNDLNQKFKKNYKLSDVIFKIELLKE